MVTQPMDFLSAIGRAGRSPVLCWRAAKKNPAQGGVAGEEVNADYISAFAAFMAAAMSGSEVSSGTT
jgi:hypothetical protein